MYLAHRSWRSDYETRLGLSEDVMLRIVCISIGSDSVVYPTLHLLHVFCLN